MGGACVGGGHAFPLHTGFIRALLALAGRATRIVAVVTLAWSTSCPARATRDAGTSASPAMRSQGRLTQPVRVRCV